MSRQENWSVMNPFMVIWKVEGGGERQSSERDGKTKQAHGTQERKCFSKPMDDTLKA